MQIQVHTHVIAWGSFMHCHLMRIKGLVSVYKIFPLFFDMG
jgi:hypothetical protein